MATELSDWFLHNWDLSSYPVCSEIQDGGEVWRADQSRNCGSSWKRNSKKHKKATKYGVKILNGRCTKIKKYFK